MAKKIRDEHGNVYVQKKPFYKRVWFIVLVGLFVLGGLGKLAGSDKELTDTSSSSVLESSQSSTSSSTEASTTEAITLVANELGQFGKRIVMNEGTDMSEELIVFYLPAGTYQVENIGDYPAQISVYEGFKRDESTGYDDYTATGDVKLIKQGNSDTIVIPEGWFVEIHEPAKFSLVRQ
ncbi:TPA: hypothetical protein ACHWCB_000081 [Streptococcus suis]